MFNFKNNNYLNFKNYYNNYFSYNCEYRKIESVYG